MVIGMFIEQPPDLLAVLLQLLIQSLQQLDQRQGQSALGPNDDWWTAKLVGFGKDFQPLLVEFRPVKPMPMQEFFPLASSGLLEQLGSRKLLHKAPARGCGPII